MQPSAQTLRNIAAKRELPRGTLTGGGREQLFERDTACRRAKPSVKQPATLRFKMIGTAPDDPGATQ
jgi:hypothetical protein